MKTCKKIRDDYVKAYEALSLKYEAAMFEAVRREFPVGTRVRFPHGLAYIEGVVKDWGSRVEADMVFIVNPKSGACWRKEAYRLEALGKEEKLCGESLCVCGKCPPRQTAGKRREKLSKCCGAPVSVRGHGHTHWFACDKCYGACDLRE